MEPNIETIRELSRRHGNWGRWGPDDERGTLNLVTPEMVVSAAALVRRGKTISMALPYDENGPQTGNLGRFNPIHLMIRDGADVIAVEPERPTHVVVRPGDEPVEAGTDEDGRPHSPSPPAPPGDCLPVATVVSLPALRYE